MNFVYVFLLSAAIVITQLLVGGTRLVYSLPGYALIAAAALLSVFSFRRPRMPLSGWCLGITATVFAYLLARAAASPVDFLWWMDFYQMIACLMVYFLTTLYVTGRRERQILICVLLALAVVEVCFGLRQFAVGDNWMPFGFKRADYGHRASGSLISSIHFAGYLETVGILALSLTFWSTWPLWGRLLVGYVGILCYLGVAVSGSRGAYLSSVFSLLIFAVMSLWVLFRIRRGKFWATAVGVCILATLAIGGGYTLMTKSDVLRQRLLLIGKRDVRIYNWQAALDQFRVAPVVGTGAGTHLYYGRFYRRPELQADPIHAHSDYLETLAEYGLIGLVGLVGLVVFHLDQGWRSVSWTARKELAGAGPYGPLRDDALALDLGALSAVAALVAHSAVDFNLHIPGNALVFAFIFGMLANPNRTRATEIKLRPIDGIFRAALPALGAWMAVSGLPKFQGEYWCEKAHIALYYKRFSEAAELAGRALQFETRNPNLYYYLAGAQLGVGLKQSLPDERRARLMASVEASENSLQLFPQNVHALVRLARALDGLERFREGGNAFTRALALDPNLSTLHAEYARHLTAVGRLEEAKAEAEIAAKPGAQKSSQYVEATPLAE